MEEKASDKLLELKEMSILSLSHTSPENFYDVIKIIKNFFGVFLDIKDEYTYGDLLDRIKQAGLGEELQERISKFIGRLSYMLYKKASPTESDYLRLKQEFTGLINELVPESSTTQPALKPRPKLLSRLLHHKNKPATPQTEAPQKPVEPDVQTKPSLNADGETKNQKKIPQEPIAEPETQIKEGTNQIKIPKEKPEKAQASKSSNIESQINQLESAISKLNSANTQFLELELESIKGDYGLFLLDNSAIDEKAIQSRINKLKSRF